MSKIFSYDAIALTYGSQTDLKTQVVHVEVLLYVVANTLEQGEMGSEIVRHNNILHLHDLGKNASNDNISKVANMKRPIGIGTGVLNNNSLTLLPF